MQLGRTFCNRRTCDVDPLLDRMRVRTFLAGTFVKAAKFAVGDADISVIEMAVYVVIGRQAVLTPAEGVGQLAERVEIGGVVKSYAIFKSKAIAILDLEGDLREIVIK